MQTIALEQNSTPFDNQNVKNGAKFTVAVLAALAISEFVDFGGLSDLKGPLDDPDDIDTSTPPSTYPDDVDTTTPPFEPEIIEREPPIAPEIDDSLGIVSTPIPEEAGPTIHFSKDLEDIVITLSSDEVAELTDTLLQNGLEVDLEAFQKAQQMGTPEVELCIVAVPEEIVENIKIAQETNNIGHLSNKEEKLLKEIQQDTFFGTEVIFSTKDGSSFAQVNPQTLLEGRASNIPMKLQGMVTDRTYFNTDLSHSILSDKNRYLQEAADSILDLSEVETKKLYEKLVQNPEIISLDLEKTYVITLDEKTIKNISSFLDAARTLPDDKLAIRSQLLTPIERGHLIAATHMPSDTHVIYTTADGNFVYIFSDEELIKPNLSKNSLN